MTKSEFKRIIGTQGNDIYFELAGNEFNIGYLPVPLENGRCGYDRLGIYEIPKKEITDEDELDISWYKTVDELLEKYVIEGSPLINQLDKVKNMHGTPAG